MDWLRIGLHLPIFLDFKGTQAIIMAEYHLNRTKNGEIGQFLAEMSVITQLAINSGDGNNVLNGPHCIYIQYREIRAFHIRPHRNVRTHNFKQR